MEFKIEELSFDEVRQFLVETDDELLTPLSQKVNIEEYAFKLARFSVFSYCLDGNQIIGLICCYMNRPPQAYISHVCVRSTYRNKGVFRQLFSGLVEKLKDLGFTSIRLEVGDENVVAQSVYDRMGFVFDERASAISRYLVFHIV